MKVSHIRLYRDARSIDVHIQYSTNKITQLTIPLHDTRRTASKYKSIQHVHTKSFWKYWLLEHESSFNQSVQTIKRKFKFKLTVSQSNPKRPPKRVPQNRRTVYCGNNRRYHGIVNGTHVVGTRYKCLRRGVGIGMNLDDNEPDTGYEPIDTRRVYCGDRNQLPNGYDMFGSLSQCLQKGVGVGKRIQRN